MQTASSLLAISLLLPPALIAAHQPFSMGELALPQLPEKIPSSWLEPQSHPLAMVSKEELASARRQVQAEPWRKAYLDQQVALCEPLLALSDAQLRALVPPPGSRYVAGIASNLDPVHGRKLKWRGWAHPFEMEDAHGRAYPNPEHPDAGTGYIDSKTGEKFYFLAQAHTEIVNRLEDEILPALAEVYALTGSQAHARAAAILLDALATTYPTTSQGPVDAPAKDRIAVGCGRMARMTFQVARALENYVWTIDLIAPSGELQHPSAQGKESIAHNIIRNLLWDGGAYCVAWSRNGMGLTNGQTDVIRGAGLVGALLDIEAFWQPLVAEEGNLYQQIEENIDRDGFYYENALGYELFGTGLMVSGAEVIEYLRASRGVAVPSVYADPTMGSLLSGSFNTREVGGHFPATGNNSEDTGAFLPTRRVPKTPPQRVQDGALKAQIHHAWVRLVRIPSQRAQAAQFLRDLHAFDGTGKFEPPSERWPVFHVKAEHAALVAEATPDAAALETGSSLIGGKGLALLRGGKGNNRYGAQLFFGPLRVKNQLESLTWGFFAEGAEWSRDPGRFNAHYRFGWAGQSVAHQSVVVDRQSVSADTGPGELLAFYDSPGIQWAAASNESAYARQGVKQFERLIAQVGNPASGTLAYWLDASRVVGGKMREDSFHTNLKKAELDLPLPQPDPERPSLMGKEDYWRQIKADYTVKGFKQGFYGVLPGSGYGFLALPREATMTRSVRLLLSDPATPTMTKPLLIADMDTAPGRNLIMAQSPDLAIQPAVPYLLRSDSGTGASLFGKLLRLVPDAAGDPIASFERLEVSLHAPSKAADPAAAWLVCWKNGRRDLWILNQREAGLLEVQAKGLPKVMSDGLVTFVEFDETGQGKEAVASGASFLSVGEDAAVTAPAGGCASGVIEAITQRAETAHFQISWKLPVLSSSVKFAGFVTGKAPSGLSPSLWVIDTVDETGVTVQGAKTSLAQISFAREGEGDWYSYSPSPSRLLNSEHQPGRSLMMGRTVMIAGKAVGTIEQISSTGEKLMIRANDGAPLPEHFHASIAEVAPGYSLTAPINLIWRRGNLQPPPNAF